ncbi:hypothetical protein, partial [Segatella sp.]|uniref:hypothetical protein n=1 Tax=Segatella sp. TaxID=2974253 RepID=UPI00307A6030
YGAMRGARGVISYIYSIFPFHRYEIFKKHFYLQQSPNFHKLGLCFSAKRTPKKAKNSKIDQPLERTTAVFSMVLGFILSKTLCPQRHSKVCFELLETFQVTLERTNELSS